MRRILQGFESAFLLSAFPGVPENHERQAKVRMLNAPAALVQRRATGLLARVVTGVRANLPRTCRVNSRNRIR